MKLIAQIKLQPTKEQADLLKRTLQEANRACNAISEIAWKEKSFGQYSLHKLVYKVIRLDFDLSAQVTIQCIKKVTDSYKKDNNKLRRFRLLGSIAFDDRILTYRTDKQFVTIWTVNGRQKIPYQCGERQAKLLESRQGESDLVFYQGNYYLLAVCNVDEPTPADIESILGIDMGIINIAVDSMGESFTGENIEQARTRYHKLPRQLQQRGTKSAKRHLKKIARKEANFRKDRNHKISKKLIKKAKEHNTGIALEELKGIRQQTTVRKSDRARHNGWAFAQLQEFILYKAMMAGIPIAFIDPRNSSRECSACHHIAKANRKSQAEFCCVKCGHSENADKNAAKNISYRATVSSPIAVRLKKLPVHATGTASSDL